MDIKRLMICVGLFFTLLCAMCENVTNELSATCSEEKRMVISNGGRIVFSDPFYRDVVDVLTFITDGDPVDESSVKTGRYRFNKMLGPFGYATVAGWGSQKRPAMVGPVRLVNATASVGGVDEESAIRALESVKDSLNRIIRYDGFVKRRKGERGTEIVSSSPVMGGWNITLSCEATGDEMWRFDLKMEYVGFAVREELRLMRDRQEVEVVSEI